MSLYAEDIAALRAAGWRQDAGNPDYWCAPDRQRWVDTREADWRDLFRDALDEEQRLPSPDRQRWIDTRERDWRQRFAAAVVAPLETTPRAAQAIGQFDGSGFPT